VISENILHATHVITKELVHLFIAALSAIAKLWKQSRCPTSDEWIKKM
jgi:hypothetical protein